VTVTTTVTVAGVNERLGSPGVRLVDCRFDLADPSWGERAYEEAHIPGAVYAHLGRDLSSPPSGTNGRHPLPPEDEMARRFGQLGIEAGVQVIAYDQDNGMYASRLWWMLRYLGHDAVAVLDGGLAAWVAAGHAVRQGRETVEPSRFTPHVRPDMLAVSADVERALAEGGARLVDARSPERFRGEVEPLDRVPGHIPGAVNRHYQRNVRSDGTFRSPAELRDEFEAVIGGSRPGAVICYCGSGVTACHNLLAMAIAGIAGGRLYAGSWSEWCADPSRPVALG